MARWSLGRWLLVMALVVPVAQAQTNETFASLKPWWTAKDFDGMADVEQILFKATNEERRKAGLTALQPLSMLTVAARQHSHEMAAENYFSHTSPHDEWSTPSLRSYRSGFWDAQVGENIVYMWIEGYEISHEELAKQFMYGEHGWMNSPPHKANILNKDYTHLGLGVARRDGRFYATQVFGSPSYQLDDVKLRRAGGQLSVVGRAKMVGPSTKVYVAVDDEVAAPRAVRRGEWFRFEAAIPDDGERHKIGLHPSKDEHSYWVKFLFYLDTSKPLDQMLVMPAEE